MKAGGTFIIDPADTSVPLKNRFQELKAKKKSEENTAREETIRQINLNLAANGPGTPFFALFKTCID